MIRIVLIDDLPIVLEGIHLLLNQIPDFKVVAEFKNGKEFLNNINKLEFDIVLTDIDMPEMNGLTLTKTLIKNYPDIKIIALSMYSDTKYYSEMINYGAKGFVLKQSSISELEIAIRNVYDGGSFFSKDLLQDVIFKLNNKEPNLISNNNQEINITEKETEILKYICNSLSNKEIAEKMFLGIKSIENSKTKLIEKTGAKNNAGLIIWAIKNKIIEI
jgi:DNA-binding NarL/FixJ family response regulator